MERAIASMAYGAEVQETMAPTPFRLVQADGTHTTFDVLGHATLHDPVLGALTIVAREAGHHELVDRVLERMVADAPFEEILVRSATLMCRPLWQMQCAGRFQDVDGNEQVVHTGVRVGCCTPPPRPDAPTSRVVRGLVTSRCFTELGQGVAFVRTLRLLSLAMLQRDQKVQLERVARHDRLTGLANRSRFFAALSATLTAARPGSAAVLYLDLDGFMAVNDTHGHAAGDTVRAVVAQRLSAVVGPADLVTRIGGDELPLLCPDLARDDPPGRLAEQLIEAVSQPIELAAHDHDRSARDVVVVGLSIGVAVIADPSIGWDCSLGHGELPDEHRDSGAPRPAHGIVHRRCHGGNLLVGAGPPDPGYEASCHSSCNDVRTYSP